jgi:hypothetical protein
MKRLKVIMAEVLRLKLPYLRFDKNDKRMRNLMAVEPNRDTSLDLIASDEGRDKRQGRAK